MRYCVGIDLGSTTTKAVILDDEGAVLGRGITNSRSNYKVACDVALTEAQIDARFGLISAELDSMGLEAARKETALAEMHLRLREQQYRENLQLFGDVAHSFLRREDTPDGIEAAVDWILTTMGAEAAELFAAGSDRRSDFFRDLAGSRYLSLAETAAAEHKVSFDRLVGVFDKTILEVENHSSEAENFEANARAALAGIEDAPPELDDAVLRAARVPMELAGSVGTGYGRATLPFPKEQIRSEILCHGLGAHSMFPATHTVLDIGGQDTKAIQVDGQGIVTSFQMNDRRINSTCTVFAGAELRERLSLGEKREDILAGLHRAIILRAMSLVARSGGITDEFTFTGGVARNPAAVEALEALVAENYGVVTLNISPDSIYTGALGAALFARREAERAPGGEA